jgi:hypothetical protein
MFYQFTYLATALKIQFVLDVLIEKRFKKNCEPCHGYHDEFGMYCEVRNIIKLGTSMLLMFFVTEGIF